MRIPTVLFAIGKNSFSLDIKSVRFFLSQTPYKSCLELPTIFSGYIVFGNEMIPCIDLNYLIYPLSYSTDNNSDDSVANDVIILKTNKGVKNTLALLVDRIDAKFIATSRYYSSTSMNFQHITWIKNQLNFGDRVFFNIDAENLMNKVENISVMSIDSEKYSNDERYNEY